jgi:hypothetical protein
MTSWLTKVAVAALGAALLVAPAAADVQSETQKAEQLQTEAERINKTVKPIATTPEGNQRIVSALAKEFKVPESTVTGLRDRNKLGYGEVAIVLALSERLAKRDHITTEEATNRILTMRQSGAGWGKISHELNLKLGPVLSDVHRADKRMVELERHEGKPDKTTSREGSDRGDKPDRTDGVDRPGSSDRVEKVERLDKSGRR